MALIKCPECGNEVSNDATYCAKCGYPVKYNLVSKPLVKKFISVMLTILGMFLVLDFLLFKMVGPVAVFLLILFLPIFGLVAVITAIYYGVKLAK